MFVCLSRTGKFKTSNLCQRVRERLSSGNSRKYPRKLNTDKVSKLNNAL